MASHQQLSIGFVGFLPRVVCIPALPLHRCSRVRPTKLLGQPLAYPFLLVQEIGQAVVGPVRQTHAYPEQEHPIRKMMFSQQDRPTTPSNQPHSRVHVHLKRGMHNRGGLFPMPCFHFGGATLLGESDGLPMHDILQFGLPNLVFCHRHARGRPGQKVKSSVRGCCKGQRRSWKLTNSGKTHTGWKEPRLNRCSTHPLDPSSAGLSSLPGCSFAPVCWDPGSARQKVGVKEDEYANCMSCSAPQELLTFSAFI